MQLITLALVLSFLENTHNAIVVAADEDGYADGYEYEYVYADEDEVVDIDVTGNAAQKPGSTPPAEDPSIAAALVEEQQRALYLARKAAEEQEIQKRNQGKQGYKQSVGGSLNTNLTPLRNKRLIELTAADIDCEPLGKWGTRLEVDNKADKLQKDKDLLTAANAKKRANLEGAVGGSLTDDIADSNAASDTNTSDGDSSGIASSNKKGGKPKKPTFRELQAKKMEEKAAKDELVVIDPSALILQVFVV